MAKSKFIPIVKKAYKSYQKAQREQERRAKRAQNERLGLGYFFAHKRYQKQIGQLEELKQQHAIWQKKLTTLQDDAHREKSCPFLQ